MRRARRRRQQHGQETLQAVLVVAFMLLPVLFGIVELGGLIHVWIGQQSAAAIGARVAGERGEDDALVRDRVAVELRAAGLDPANVQVTVSPAYVHWGQPIIVRVISQRHLAIPFLFSRDLTLASSYVGRGEVNH
jgi:Flp pilus assembly protein TadG